MSGFEAGLKEKVFTQHGLQALRGACHIPQSSLQACSVGGIGDASDLAFRVPFYFADAGQLTNRNEVQDSKQVDVQLVLRKLGSGEEIGRLPDSYWQSILSNFSVKSKLAAVAGRATPAETFVASSRDRDV